MNAPGFDLSEFRSELSVRNRIGRALWGVVNLLLFRPTPRPFHAWRRFWLRIFGAKPGRGVRAHSPDRGSIGRRLRMSPGAVCMLGVYYDGAILSRPHTIAQYSNGYFRKALREME